jgi:hypothetical protein
LPPPPVGKTGRRRKPGSFCRGDGRRPLGVVDFLIALADTFTFTSARAKLLYHEDGTGDNTDLCAGDQTLPSLLAWNNVATDLDQVEKRTNQQARNAGSE